VADPSRVHRIVASSASPGEPAMPSNAGQPIETLDSPQLLLDLDVVDANAERLLKPLRGRPIDVRVHFKSLKCSGLARYLGRHGLTRFLAAKLNEAEVLADAGITDVFVANQVV